MADITYLERCIAQVGGPAKAARICGVTQPAVGKWLAKGSLPRTEWTGETEHAKRLAAATEARFTAEQLLARCKP